MSIEFASKELNNKESILSLVRANFVQLKHVGLLKFVSEELCNDKDVVLDAVKNNGYQC